MLLALVATLLAAPASSPSIASLSFDPLSRGTSSLEFALPSGGGPTVGITYFVNDYTAVRADFGLDAVLSPNGFAPATFDINLGLRMYQPRRGSSVAVFFQPSIGFGREVLTVANGGTEFIDLALAFGAQYFFTDHLSVGGTVGLALGFANLGGPAGSSVITRLSTRPSGLFLGISF